MENRKISSQTPLNLPGNSGLHTPTQTPNDACERPLMMNTWSQTYSLAERVKYLEERKRVLKECLNISTEAVSQIQEITQQNQEQHINDVATNISTYNSSNNNISGVKPISPKIVNALNPLPIESVKYTIVAESSGRHSNEPIEVELAEDDGAVFLAPEKNMDLLSIDTPASSHSKKRSFCNDQPTSLCSSANVEHDLRTITSCSSDNMKTNNSNTSGICNDINNVMVTLGPNNTCISAKLYEKTNWSTVSSATRNLLTILFDRKTLATHSLTGKPSPAFQNKPPKEKLNADIVNDIVHTVSRKCNVPEREVRNAIATKCADENKLMKIKEQKLRERNEKRNLS